MKRRLRKNLLLVFARLAAIGLLLSIFSHAASLFGMPPPLGGYTWLLHIGIFVVWLPAVLTMNRLTKGAPRDQFWKIALGGCPRWMRALVYGFGLYAVGNFTLFMMTTGIHRASRGGALSPAEVRGFSGHWMAFYSAAFAVLYSGAASSEAEDKSRRGGADDPPLG